MTEPSTTAEKREAIYLTVPAKIGKDSPSIKEWSFESEGSALKRDMVEVTLPYGTTLKGEDVSYFKFSVPKFQVDPGGQKYPSTHSIRQNPDKETGEWYPLKLSRDFGKMDENTNKWVEDKKTLLVDPADLRDALKEQYQNYKETRAEKGQEEAENPTKARIAESKDNAAQMNEANAPKSELKQSVGVEHS